MDSARRFSPMDAVYAGDLSCNIPNANELNSEIVEPLQNQRKSSDGDMKNVVQDNDAPSLTSSASNHVFDQVPNGDVGPIVK